MNTENTSPHDKSLYQTLHDALEQIGFHTSSRDRLDILAEEGSELTHAALKLSRILHKNLPSPVSISTAQAELREEMADVIVCAMAAGLLQPAPDNDGAFIAIPEVESKVRYKLLRWCNRITADRRTEMEL